jgi:hypothetical protein
VTVIALSSEFLPDVVSGDKVSTIRRGRRNYPLGGALLRARDRDIAIDIRRVRYSKIRDLTVDDARRDGFENVEELKTALSRFYPQLQPEDDVTIVEFVVGGAVDS